MREGDGESGLGGEGSAVARCYTSTSAYRHVAKDELGGEWQAWATEQDDQESSAGVESMAIGSCVGWGRRSQRDEKDMVGIVKICDQLRWTIARRHQCQGQVRTYSRAWLAGWGAQRRLFPQRRRGPG